MKARLIVVAQYSENYSFHDWNGQGQCPQGWKMKGGVTFEVKVSDMEIMYMEEECIAVVKEMLKEMSNDCVAYEYHSHEVKFGNDVMLDEDIFNNKLNKLKLSKTA